MRPLAIANLGASPFYRWEDLWGHRKTLQLPGNACAEGKNGSFQLIGFVLMTPVLYICSAYFIVPFGVIVKTKPGLLIISASSSTLSFSRLALRYSSAAARLPVGTKCIASARAAFMAAIMFGLASWNFLVPKMTVMVAGPPITSVEFSISRTPGAFRAWY